MTVLNDWDEVREREEQRMGEVEKEKKEERKREGEREGWCEEDIKRERERDRQTGWLREKKHKLLRLKNERDTEDR